MIIKKNYILIRIYLIKVMVIYKFGYL